MQRVSSVERAKIKKVHDALRVLTKTRDMRILVRSVDFKPVGLIVRREQLFDSSIGRSRDWAQILTTDNNLSREPLDTIHPGTNELKPCIIAENAYLVITARISYDISNDPENFQWFASPSQMNAWHELNDQIELKDGVINSAQSRIDSLIAEKDRYFKQAELLGGENRNLSAQNQRLSVGIAALTQRVIHAERNVQLDRKNQITIAAKDAHEIKTASEVGKTLGSNTDELTDKALQKSADRNKKMHALQSSDGMIFKQIDALSSDMQAIKQALNLSQSQPAQPEGGKKSS
jgi:hypothetical protein